jgi:uncharacterized membrane protein YfcA
MELSLPYSEIVLLLAGGAFAGILSGLFGVGGGGVLVPVLYDLFGLLGAAPAVRMHLAIGTTFAVIIPTTFRAARAHYRRGAVDAGILRTLGPACSAGVMIGAVAARSSGDTELKIIWVIAAALLCLVYLFKKESWRFAAEMPGPAVQIPVGAGVGFLSSVMGVGGATYLTPFLQLYGRPIHQAIGTAAGCTTFVAIPAVIGYAWAGWGAAGLPPYSLGYVSLFGAATIIPASVLAAPVGVRLAHGLSRRRLEIAFAGFLALVALRFVFALLA